MADLSDLLQQVGQGFELGAFFQKSFALLALNQWNVDVVLLAPAFAVDPYSGTDTQPNVPRDIKSQIDLRLSRAVGCSADVIVEIGWSVPYLEALCFKGR